MAGVDIEILSDARPLEEDWWGLWQRSPAATPFQSPAWLLPWRKQFDEGDSRVLTVRHHGRLMALVPLFRHADRLLLWGAGTSDWLDGIFDPALDPAALLRGVAALEDPLDLFQLRVDSPLMQMPAPKGWTERFESASDCVTLALPARLSSSMAQKLRYYRRRAARAGVADPVRTGAASFEDLVRLHTYRWNERGEQGVLADARVITWHRESLPALESAGLLRFYTLRMEARAVAALYVLSSKGRAFYYISGFDPEYAALGLGTVLVGHAIAEAEREGAHTFDFLRGQESYKYRWGGVDCPTYGRYIDPSGGENCKPPARPPLDDRRRLADGLRSP